MDKLSKSVAMGDSREEALQFYANPENWDDAYFVEDEPNCITAVMSTIDNDQGKKARAALARPVQEPVAWESPEEWEIEQQAFHAAGRSDVPQDVQKLVEKLWAMYCDAAAPQPAHGTSATERGPAEKMVALTPLENKYLPLAKELVKGGGFNHPDPRDDDMRLVGFRVPVEIAGLSEALFALDAIRAALKSSVGEVTND